LNRLGDTTHALQTRNSATFSFDFARQAQVEKLWVECRSLQLAVRDAEALSEYYEMFLAPVQRARTKLSTLPFQYSGMEMGIQSTIELLASNAQSLDDFNAIRVIVERTLTLLEKLIHERENPINEKLLQALEEGAVVVVKDSFWVSPLTSHLEKSCDFPLRVIQFKRLLDEEISHKMVYLGSPFYFSSRYRSEPDTRFLLDPKSALNHFILYPFGKSPDVDGLIDSSAISRSVRYSLPFGSMPEMEMEALRSEWEVISASAEPSNSETEIMEMARFVGLANGHHMWMSARPDSRCRVVVVSSEGVLELESRQTSELHEGELIVERIGRSSPILIDSVADGLGALRLRASQSHWKDALKQRIEETGNLKAVQRSLSNEYGVDVQNLRHWVYDPRSIAPNSKSDFLGTCRYLGLIDSAESLWTDLQAIRKLHLKAGGVILARLRSAVLALSGDDLVKSGGMSSIHIEDCGALGVFRVEYVEETAVLIPISMIDVVAKNDEAL